MNFARKNTIIGTIVAIQLFLLIVLFVGYIVIMGVYFKKIRSYILKKETTKFKNISLFILRKEKESMENILNSFALWEKFYFHCVKRDTSWIKVQLEEDPQVEKNFDIYGIFLENGVSLYHKDGILPYEVAIKIIQRFKRTYRKGEIVKEFFFCFSKINGKTYYIGASPLADDMGHLLSYGFVYFGKSIERFVEAIRILTPEARVSFKVFHQEGAAFVPLKDAFGEVIAYIMLPFPKYMETELAKLGELEIILGLFILFYAFMVYMVLKYWQERIVEELKLMLEAASTIKDFRPNLHGLKELAEREDEIGAIARSLLPVAESIASRVVRDPLTGIFNREYFFVRLQEELERVKRFKRSLSVAIFDIDDFKVVNDSLGHPAGDEILKQLCDLIRNQIRSTDIFARIGGEEFGIILPETDVRGAHKVCEKLRKMVEETDFKINGKFVKITVSFGVTQAKDTDTVESLYERADVALYLAKKKGKNRVAIL